MLITLDDYAVQAKNLTLSSSLFAHSIVHVGQTNEVDIYSNNNYKVNLRSNWKLYIWFWARSRIRGVLGMNNEKLNKAHDPLGCAKKAYGICTKKYREGTNDHFICYTHV